MSELLDMQKKHVGMVAKLIDFAHSNGYELTWGDTYRDPRVHGDWGDKKSYSAAFSTHKVKLAVDFNLFKDGKYLQMTEDHRPLGEFWESIGGTWGGRHGDGNHYSLEWQGFW